MGPGEVEGEDGELIVVMCIGCLCRPARPGSVYCWRPCSAAVARCAATRARVALGVRSPSAWLVGATRLDRDPLTCGDERPGQAGSRFATGIEGLDLRGAARWTAPECPDRCACPVNLWTWARPRMAAAVAEALGEGWTRERRGEPRPVGTLADPDSPISRWVRGEPLFGEGSFTCPRCGMTSHSPDNVREGYCGNCHDWTRPVEPGEANP